MSLIVEDGSIVANAESYLSVADADTYHSLRGNTSWAGTSPATSTSAKEAALRKATEFINNEYYGRWKGELVDEDQSLAWPRNYAINDETGQYYDSESIPLLLKRATAEMALIALTEEFYPTYDPTAIVISESSKVSVIEEKKTYRAPSEGSLTRKQWPILQRLLAPLVEYPGDTVRLVRS